MVDDVNFWEKQKNVRRNPVADRIMHYYQIISMNLSNNTLMNHARVKVRHGSFLVI